MAGEVGADLVGLKPGGAFHMSCSIFESKNNIPFPFSRPFACIATRDNSEEMREVRERRECLESLWRTTQKDKKEGGDLERRRRERNFKIFDR